MKKLWIFGIVGVALLLIFLLGSSLLSVVGVSNNLEYETEWSLNDLDKGIGQSVAILKLPKLTNEFSFTVDYGGEIESIRDKGTCYVDVDYEIFNFKNNRFEKFHDKSWSMKEYDKRDSEVRFDGEGVYGNGFPDYIESIKTRDSDHRENRRYDYHISCLDGMSVSEAKFLRCEEVPTLTKCTDNRYTWKCMYGGDVISEHECDDENWEHNDLVLFPKLNTYGIDYINNDTAKFKITVNKRSNCESLDENDFEIDLWDVKTELVKFYRFSNNECNEIELMTYRKTVNDYEILFDCQENIILDKYVLEDNQCSFQKVKFTEIDSNMFDTEEECLSGRSIWNKIWNWIKFLFEKK